MREIFPGIGSRGHKVFQALGLGVLAALYILAAILITASATGCALLGIGDDDEGGMICSPSGRKGEAYGYLHQAEGLLGDKFQSGRRLAVRFVAGVRMARGRWVMADGSPSSAGTRGGTIQVTLVTEPGGAMNGGVAVHEFAHAIMFSVAGYPQDEAGQHGVMRSRGVYPW